jgi:hypothetical protein
MSDVDIEITDNSGQYLQALDGNLDRALEAIGLQAAGYAALNLEHSPRRIDTGLLRNSITYAVAGENPAKHSYHADTGDGSGQYSGRMPKATGEKSVYIGTNVEYAIYVHEGATLPSGGHMEANRFLRNAVSEHSDEYRSMIIHYMEGG